MLSLHYSNYRLQSNSNRRSKKCCIYFPINANNLSENTIFFLFPSTEGKMDFYKDHFSYVCLYSLNGSVTTPWILWLPLLTFFPWTKKKSQGMPRTHTNKNKVTENVMTWTKTKQILSWKKTSGEVWNTQFKTF